MTEPEGPLDIIPRVNYPPLLTMANYHSTKQMIDQVLNEDQEYVSWKLKSMRTGGTMNSYMQNVIPAENRSKFTMDEPVFFEYKSRDQRPRKIFKKRSNKINDVPKDLKFPRDYYLENIDQVPLPRKLDQDERFKLLVTNLDSEQTNRFEVFHRTSLNKTQVKKLAGMVINQSVTENIRVFLQAIGKMYACEIIELTLDVR